MKLNVIALVYWIALCVSNVMSLNTTSMDYVVGTSHYHKENTVDLSRFTQLLHNHLLFDHYEQAFHQLSRKISMQFRDSIHVKMKKTSKVDVIVSPVDVQVLKRQLRGAVGSFVEDKLPYILNNRYKVSNLQSELDTIIYHHCPHLPNNGVTYDCLSENREGLLMEIQSYTNKHIQSTLSLINQDDLPKLFEKTRAQISGILTHFNKHTMTDHRLELKNKQFADRVWITDEMIDEFISIINHTDSEEENSSIMYFSQLSR
ncbi:hypothetical protein BDB01DRAFT_446125 [Pilobolus umbonatus]|nr:hypothetical protein BDB01DRAFT_446125 [Pilobolus umbonatus]